MVRKTDGCDIFPDCDMTRFHRGADRQRAFGGTLFNAVCNNNQDKEEI